MKKNILIIFCFFIAQIMFSQTINSKQGYLNLKWGSTIKDAQNAGFSMTDISQTVNDITAKRYTEETQTFSVKSNDKKVSFIFFRYYKGKLFQVDEIFSYDGNMNKLETRYGKFKEKGIFSIKNNNFFDALYDSEGKVTNLSISIALQEDKTAIVNLFDWSVYKKISVDGKILSGEEKTIVQNFENLASKLIPPSKNTLKASFAFISFTSNNKDSAIENYITDALAEAVFLTGKVKIIERSNIEKILKEQNFQASGFVNDNTAKSIGNIAGVDFICLGSINDVDDELTISARVVDVETGEIYAMAREIIKKDLFINSLSTSVSKQASQPAETKKTTNSLWQVRKSRNAFDEYTTYTFFLKGPGDVYVFVGYDKYDSPIHSKVRAGIYGSGWNYGTFEFKQEDGKVITKRFDRAVWSFSTGWKDGRDDFYFTYNKGESARFFIDMFEKNNLLIIRHDNVVQRFQTLGLWEIIENQDITRQEIEAAIGNEEF